VRLETVKSGGLAHSSYYLSEGREALVVDPRRDCEVYAELARRDCSEIRYIFETHRNEDYVIGSLELQEMTGAEICHSGESPFRYGEHRLGDGEEFNVGRLRVEALHTPGHTIDSLCYAVYDTRAGEEPLLVFTGDTLFMGDVGRTDLPGLDLKEEMSGMLYDSLHEKVLPLGDIVLLYPSHTAGSICGSHISDREMSTLGYERATNPQLSMDRETFVKNRLNNMMLRPPYFRRMEEWNLNGPPLLKDLPPPKLLTVDKFEIEWKKETSIVLDVRQPDAFAGSHIPGSINIWLEGVSYFPGWVLSYDRRILLVADRREDVETAVNYLRRIGYDDIAGHLCPSMAAWRNAGGPVETIHTISVAEARRLVESGDIDVLDVREEHEWDEGHIGGARRIYVGQLPDEADSLPKERPTATICGWGGRSGIAASILKREGFSKVYSVLGGMNAWKSLEYPESKE